MVINFEGYKCNTPLKITQEINKIVLSYLGGQGLVQQQASVVQQTVTLLILSYKREKKFLEKLASKELHSYFTLSLVPDYSAYRGTNQECRSKEVARLPLHCLGRDVKESGQEHPD